MYSESDCALTRDSGSFKMTTRKESVLNDKSEKIFPKFSSSYSSLSSPFSSFRQILRRIRSSIGLTTVSSYEFNGFDHVKNEKLSHLTNNTRDIKMAQRNIKTNNENDRGNGSGSLNLFNKKENPLNSAVSSTSTCDDDAVSSPISVSTRYIRNIARKDRYKRSTKATSLQIRKRSRSLSAKASSTTSVTCRVAETGSSSLYAAPLQLELEREKSRREAEGIPSKKVSCSVPYIYETNV